MYELDFSQKVDSYLKGSRLNFRVSGVKAVLQMAAETLDGLPDDPDSCYHLSKTNHVYWLVEDHLVAYERRGNEMKRQ